MGNLTADDVLDDITLYWLMNAGFSSARPHHEHKLRFFDAEGVSFPVASTFPKELCRAGLRSLR